MQSVVAYDETGQQTKVSFDYDQYGNVLNKREYGFQISGAWQVRRNWSSFTTREVSVFKKLTRGKGKSGGFSQICDKLLNFSLFLLVIAVARK